MNNRKSKTELSYFFKKADLILLAVFLLLGVGSIVAAGLGSGDGSTVVISVDGKQYGTYPLNVDREISVDSEFGHNTVTISSGAVAITESDCPNHDCEAFRAISMPVQSIMCLPHRLIVRISGQTEIDTVIY